MFVRKTPNGKDFTIYIVEGYRDALGKAKQRVLLKLGLLSELTKNNPNAFADLQKKYRNKRLTLGKKTLQIPLNISISQAKKSVNYGYFFIEKVFRDLGIGQLISNHSKKSNFGFDLESILKVLVFSRILKPSSKKFVAENQNQFFGYFNNNLIDFYRSLSLLSDLKEDIQQVMHKNIVKSIGRDLSLVLYDLTNYYFEIEKADDFKKPGVSKEQRKNPLVQMGLLIDKNKIPVGYQLFPGNIHDSKTVLPMLQKLKDKFGIQRTTLIADKGINTSFNFAKLIAQGNGYIVSQKIRGAKKAFITEVLNEEGYTYWGDSFKFKELYRTRVAQDQNKNKIELKEKVVIYWSRNFDQHQKHKHKHLDEKIERFLKNPSVLNASNAYGIKRYIKTKHIVKETGEVKKAHPKSFFNQDKYERDVALDGYYAIVTSELNKSVYEILASYKELWKIEESFKVVKSDLEGRPIYVQRKDRIEGHFLTCFIALTIMRILERKLAYKHSVKAIKKSLASATCKEFVNGYYSFEPQDDILRSLQKLNGVYIENGILKAEQVRRYKKAV